MRAPFPKEQVTAQGDDIRDPRATKCDPTATTVWAEAGRNCPGFPRGECPAIRSQKLPEPDPAGMERGAVRAPCEHAGVGALAQGCCGDRKLPEEARGARNQVGFRCLGRRRCGRVGTWEGGPVGAGAAAPREEGADSHPPPPPPPPPEPQPRDPLAECPSASGSRSWDPESVPYLEGPAPAPGDSWDQDEDSDSTTSSGSDGGDAPDGTRSPFSADGDPAERRQERRGCGHLPTMIPRKPQEGLRADSARAAAVLARSPGGEDAAAGQRKEGAVCIGHRDAPRASSPPRHLQHDPFPFFPDPHASEGEGPHHEPPYVPPAVCIGHRDAPRASSPPRHAPFDPFPFLPDAAGAQGAGAHHEPALCFQDAPGASLESLALSTDSLRASPGPPPPVCIGHRDAPRASSPPRHPPSDLALLATSPPPGSSGGSRASAAPGETRHNLEREEYSVLADLPPPRRRVQREPPQPRTPSPGRAEVERLFGQERRKSEAPGAFQAREEGRSRQPGPGQMQLPRRQSSPALGREPRGPPDSTRGGHAGVPASRLPETPPDRGPGGACPHQPATPEKRPEFDWRDLVGLLGVREPAGSPSLPRLCWDRLLELLQAPLPRRDPGPTRDPTGPAPPSWPEGGTLEPLLNGHDPAQGPQGAGQDPSPACTPAPGPHTRVDTSGQETPVPAGLKEEPRSPAGGPSSPEKLHPEEPEGSELSRGPDSPGQTQKQKQADSADKRPAEGKAGSPLKGRLVTSWRMPGDRPTLFNPLLLSLGVLRWQRPDLLNFKKGWMSILDEPGEWKKHWFVLTDSSLKYYRDSTAEEADELDGEVDLRACTDVTEYPVQRNYGFQIHTKDAVYTLSAMTSGIRRNWIEALRKTVRPANAPDVTKLSDSNKENTLHGYGPAKGTLRPGEPRGGSARKADGPRPALDYVELSPLSRGLGAPLTADQQSRLSEEIEKKWQELEKLPLREGRRVPLSALLGQGQGQGQGRGDGHEALEREVQSLRAQLEAWRLRGETPGAQDDGRIPPGYISQEACERSLAEMESSHQQLMEELQRHHARELQRLQQEKERLLAEETAATASAIEAVKKAYKEELSRELSKTRGGQQGPDGLRKQHQSDVEALRRELQVLSEGYSQKCLEIGALTRQAEEREHQLRCCQQEGQELLRHNQDLHGRLSEEIERLRSFIASQGAGNGCGRGGEQRSSCELEVLLRVKENELQYLKREVQALRDELQTLQKDKRFSSGQYQDVYVELNHIKTRSEREIEQLKEHLRLAMAALQERAGPRHSLAD
nr:unnamed protein product [Sorex araneus]